MYVMYNFDEVIDRRHTNAMNTDGFRGYIFHADETMTFPYADEDFIRMWVADMEFATPDVVIDGMRSAWISGFLDTPGYLKRVIMMLCLNGVKDAMTGHLTEKLW